MRTKSVTLFVAALVLAACGVAASPAPSGGPYPAGCADIGFPATQCDAIVAIAQKNASIAPQTVTSIDILQQPFVSNGTVGDGHGVIAIVRFHRAGQPDKTVEVLCTGVTREYAFACSPDPRISIYGGRLDGDTPCGIDGKTCATPPPTPRAAVQAIARPLRVASLDIPIDHLGLYEVEVGEAGLPDGALSTRSGTVGDPKPETFWIAESIEIDVRPVDPARPPIHSIYREPFDGVEPVKVFLVFYVTELTSDSVLQVRDLFVE